MGSLTVSGNLFFTFWNKAWITAWLLVVYAASLWLVLGALSSYQLQSRISADNEQNQSGNTVPAVMRQLRAVGIIEDQIIGTQEKIKTTKRALQDAKVSAYKLEIKAVNPDDIASENMLKSRKREIPIKKLALQVLEFDLRELKREQRFLLRENDLILDYLTELTDMKKFGFEFLTTMPGQLLTLFLTLSMGALGSIIYLTRAFFDPSAQHNFTWYLFRPFLGMIMALAIFVLVKSGQLTITEGGGANDLSGLSPFFLSFVAIISGLLSEQAYQKIYTAGQNFFGAQETNTGRWALNLDKAIQSKGKQASELLLFTSASEAEIDGWISAKSRVPQQQQNIISAWLGIPSRELFSDQPPYIPHPINNDQTNTDMDSGTVGNTQ